MKEGDLINELITAMAKKASALRGRAAVFERRKPVRAVCELSSIRALQPH
jgi:hypothetical protein